MTGVDCVFQIPVGWNAMAYVADGTGTLSGQSVKAEQATVFAEGDHIIAECGDASFRFLLISGRPINEKIIQYGPFVMNTEAEIQQAFRDYESGKLQNPDDDVWAEN